MNQLYKAKTTWVVYIAFFVGSLFSACSSDQAGNTASPAQAQLARKLQEEMDILTSQNPALQSLSERIAKDSLHAELYFARGSMLVQSNAPELAIIDFDRALLLDTTQTAYYMAAADLYFENQNLKRAIELLEKARKIAPHNPNIATELGKFYFYIKQYDKAQTTLQAAIVQKDNEAAPHFWLGMTLRDLQKDTEAIAEFEKAIEIAPALQNAHQMAAKLYAKLGNDKCLKHYDILLKLDTLNLDAQYAKALFLQNHQRTDDALKEYRKIMMKDSQYTEAYYNTGYILFSRKEYAKAYPNFDISVRTSPAYANAYYMRGLCAEALGKKEDAKKDYEKALTFDENHEKAQKALEN